jgi:5,10-methylenetetrahydromethanopterin reductase
MEISIGVVPGPDAVRRAQLAEELGFARVWLYDSAAIYEDIWMNLTEIVANTSIDVGTAVLVPNLRHVMTTASAIATLERMAPGRLTAAFGTGLTARWVLGKSALSWATLRTYVEQLHGLLHGETVTIAGARAQMIHLPHLAAQRPIATPLLMSALGPKGLAITAEMVAEGTIDGLIDTEGADGEFGRRVQMVSGTVLDSGEDGSSARVRDAVGPWFVVGHHYVWQQYPEVLPAMPAGTEWLAGIEADRPEGERHLIVHEGHVTDVSSRDRQILDAATDESILAAGWVGEKDAIAERAAAAAARGVTELLYTPAGSDVEREMRAFAAATIR